MVCLFKVVVQVGLLARHHIQPDLLSEVIRTVLQVSGRFFTQDILLCRSLKDPKLPVGPRRNHKKQHPNNNGEHHAPHTDSTYLHALHNPSSPLFSRGVVVIIIDPSEGRCPVFKSEFSSFFDRISTQYTKNRSHSVRSHLAPHRFFPEIENAIYFRFWSEKLKVHLQA